MPTAPFPPGLAPTERLPRGSTVDVLGGGIAGACMVRALAVGLARQGRQDEVQLRLIETQAPASGASAAPLALYHPLLSRDHNLASQLVWQGIQTTHHWLTQLGGYAEGWAAMTGAVEVFQPPHHEGIAALARHPDLAGGLRMLSSTEAQSLLAGWAVMPRLVEACLADARHRMGAGRVRILTQAPRVTVEGLLSAPQTSHVVVATAHGDGLPERIRQGLALAPLGGQLSWMDTPHLVSPALPPLVQIRCGQGYAVHAGPRLYVGASFVREPSQAEGALEPSPQDHTENLHRLAELSPAWADAVAPAWHRQGGTWASVRWASRDRLPHVGSVVDPQITATPQMSQLHHLPRMARVSVLLGLGSRGLSLAPLAAEALAARILGLPQPLAPRLADAVDPARFVLRTHRRAH